MTKKEFIAKYEGWFSYTHREELKKQMENDLEAVFQKLNESKSILKTSIYDLEKCEKCRSFDTENCHSVNCPKRV